MGELLLVEDDDAIGVPLARALGREGHVVTRVATGRAALDRLAGGRFDVVVLDLGLPDLDGLEVCRRAKADAPDLPILLLTARADELDEVTGLDAGADDYLAKPFTLAVLGARLRALLRRAAPAEQPVGHGLRIDRAARRAWRAGSELELSPKEFDLLATLAAQAGAVVSREELMRRVWDENWWGSTKTLDVHVGWLRRKLGDPGLLTTVRGVGFRLERA